MNLLRGGVECGVVAHQRLIIFASPRYLGNAHAVTGCRVVLVPQEPGQLDIGRQDMLANGGFCLRSQAIGFGGVS